MMKIKCKICGCEFNPIIERHYVSRDINKIGLAAAITGGDEERLYDTFDCVQCGCQIIVQERKRTCKLFISESKIEADDEEDEEKED